MTLVHHGADIALPPLEHPLVATFARRFWWEFTVPAQNAALEAAPVWSGQGLAPGDGQPVMLVPGYMADDNSMQLIARWLREAEYEVAFAPVGRNAWGSSTMAATIERELVVGDRPVTLIGHSRGGQQARVVAGRVPELVDRLITLGSPVRYHRPPWLPIRLGIDTARLLRKAGIGPQVTDEAEHAFGRELSERPLDPSVPWTAVWTKRDGIVQWQACVAEGADNVEVVCTHLGLTGSVSSFEAIAAALAR